MPSLQHGEVSLFYEEAGSGAPAVVLLHAWGGDHTWMAPLHEHLRRRHRVVSMDLRGFGRSDRPPPPYTMQSQVGDLVELCSALELGQPVLVGHDLGGTIALAAVAQHAALARGLVLLDAPVVPPPNLRHFFEPLHAALHTPGWTQVVRDFFDQLAGPHFDPRDRARMREAMAENPQTVLISVLAHLMGFDSEAAAAACRVPALYVSGGTWLTDVERFRRRCPQLATAQLFGCGHFFPLEVPDQTNAVVGRFVDLVTRG